MAGARITTRVRIHTIDNQWQPNGLVTLDRDQLYWINLGMVMRRHDWAAWIRKND